MEFLLIAALVSYYMTRNTVQDLAWKARGEDPPSFRREQARIARREARRPITDKREARKFLANAWADAWEAAGEHRERIHSKRQEKRRDQWRVQDLEEAEDQAYERNTRDPKPTTADSGKGAEPAHCEVCKAAVPADEITVATITGAGGERHLVWACPACIAAESKRKPEAAPQPAGHGEPARPWTPPSPGEDPTPGPKPTAANTGDTTGGAQIIQFPVPEDTTNQEDSVSETTSLNAALAYTSTMAANSQQGATGVETSIGGLTAGGVSGPTIAALHAAQEALTLAAAQFQAAHAALVRHIQVQEAYAANQDAGKKEFVTAD